MKVFHCPTNFAPEGDVATSHYAGLQNDVEAPIDVDNNGVLFLNSGVRVDDILDGSAHTIFIGESADKTTEHWYVEECNLGWMSGTRSTLRNTGARINSVLAKDDNGGDLWKSDKTFVGGFGSSHPGGAEFSFGDGHVSFLSKYINFGVYQQLGHRADGKLMIDREH